MLLLAGPLTHIKVTLECISRVSEVYGAYMRAETEVDHQWLLLDHLLGQLRADLHFLELNAHRLEPDIERRLRGILRFLNARLQDVTESFNGALDADGRVRRHWWVLEVQPRLAKLVPEIEAWQRRFLDHIQLLRWTGFKFDDAETGKQPRSNSADHSTVERLSGKILLARIAEIPAEALEMSPPATLLDSENNLESLAQASLKTLVGQDTQTSSGFLVECRKQPEDADVEQVKSVACSIARILAAAGSEGRKTHLLQAVGYTYLPHPARELQLVLKYPAGTQSPRTLRNLLESAKMPSINARLELCRQAAVATFYTHTSGLVHKSIRPEAFLVFRDVTQEVGHVASPHSRPMPSRQRDDNGEHDVLGTLYLTGFELAREDKPGSFSSMRGSVDWEQKIYSHPSRHSSGTRYTMAYDVYSLGVNLLEIALWQSFICFDHSEQRMVFNEEAIPGGREICHDLRRGVRTAGSRLQVLYLEAARVFLPCSMGNRFRDITLYCLRAIEDGLGNEDETGREVSASAEENIGLRFIDKVLAKLDAIRL